MAAEIPFLSIVKKELPGLNVRAVCEVGARDCEDTVKLSEAWPSAHIYAFEPNPNTIPMCLSRIWKIPRIKLFPMAVSDVSGTVDFYQSTTENQGYSSLFEPSGKYDTVERMPCNKIKVECTRLDMLLESCKLAPPEVMWLDAQGSELNAIKSLGRFLPSLRAVWTEYLLDEMYKGVPLLQDIKTFMEGEGFRLARMWAVGRFNGKDWFGDCVFVR